jgi:L-ascorbate metabolism protein UlaG (beta-lactamase superfamily)
MPRQILLPADNQTTRELDDGRIIFIGTATVLLKLGGYTLLTDPNFLHRGDHIHLGYGMFSRRLTDPAMDIEEVPPLDAILLSHFHRDHFDLLAERRLNKEIPIVTTPEAAKKLSRTGFKNVAPLKRWESVDLVKPGALPLKVTAMPARHGPPAFSRLQPQVMGSMLEFSGESTFRIYISGDTLLHPDWLEIPKRYPEVDLALLHLGGTRVLQILVTMDAEQGIEAVKRLNARTTIPIHFDDYPVFKSPLKDFQALVSKAGLERRVHYMERGDTYRFSIPPPARSETRARAAR